LLDDASAWRFIDAGVPAVAGLRTGIAVAAGLAAPPPDAARLREIAAARRPAGPSRWLAEHEAKALLRARGVPVVEGAVAATEDEAVAALHALGAVAVKLSSPDMRHKSAAGAIALDVRDEDSLRAAYRRLAARGDVLVERMAAPGTEVFVSVRTDAVVPALTIGRGGIFVEALDDVAIVPLPAGERRIAQALERLRAPVPPAAAKVAAQIAAAADGLELLECNPVLVHRDGAVVVDATAKEVAT
jgi:acetate---CoA ligase (ADP-forming)